MICKYCGKEFIPKTSNQKFCCREHTYTYFQEKLNRERKERTLARKAQRVKVDFNSKDYKKNLKNYCVSCGKPISNSWDWYQVYGNYCQECDLKAFHDSEHSEQIKIIREALMASAK